MVDKVNIFEINPESGCLWVNKKVEFKEFLIEENPIQYFNGKDWINIPIKERYIDGVKFDMDKMKDWTPIDGLYVIRKKEIVND